jgi:hypothetical protein
MTDHAELHDVVQFTAAVLELRGEAWLLGPEDVESIIDLTIKSNRAWESMPQCLQDCNAIPWDIEIVPAIVAAHWEEGVVDYDFNKIRNTVMEMIMSDWIESDLRHFIKAEMIKGRTL